LWKIYRVIQIKLKQFKKMSTPSMTYQQSVLSAITVANISKSFYLQDGGKNQPASMWNKITPLSPYV